MFEKGLLGGKRILITGGGSGLGAAMGRRFLQLGAELIICGRRLELLERTAMEMREASGGQVSVHRCDVRDGGAVEAMMDEVWRASPIDVLVITRPRRLSRRRSIFRFEQPMRSSRRRCTARCTAHLPPAGAGSRPHTGAWC